MPVASVLFDGLTVPAFIAVYDPLTQFRSMNLTPEFEWQLWPWSEPVINDLPGARVVSIRPPTDITGGTVFMPRARLACDSDCLIYREHYQGHCGPVCLAERKYGERDLDHAVSPKLEPRLT